MNVLIGCERSGVVRDAFRARGHNAISVDLAPTESPMGDQDNTVKNGVGGLITHWQGDILDFLEMTYWDGPQWDLFIVFPDCTYLTASGLHWNKRIPGRAEKTKEALGFVYQLFNRSSWIPRVALENPPGRINTAIRKPDQYIQPNQFGHDASKKTGLWLRNLPPLVPTCHVAPRWVNGRPRWANQTDSGQNRLGPSADHGPIRARTYDGVADAMADQWGSL